MNCFVLCTGRCGSVTFSRACSKITNYTAAHESRIHVCGTDRLAYPSNHIEVDNRLAWFLGELENRYGRNAYYVHLTRDLDEVAQSYSHRADFGIMQAFRRGILGYPEKHIHSDLAIARHMVGSIDANIRAFLNDKPMKIEIDIASVALGFQRFWEEIGAIGDLAAALAKFKEPTNTTAELLEKTNRAKNRGLVERLARRLSRLTR